MTKHASELRIGNAARRLDVVGAGAPAAEHAALPCAAPGKRMLVAHDPYNPRSERMRALRTELMLRHDSPEHANVVAVVSSRRGDGRSQLAAELATSFAQLGRRTLLVDTDLRRPSLHLLFGAANDTGLAQVLDQDEAPLLHPVKGLRHMFLLTAGRLPPNPLELLSDGRFECLVDSWRGDFDFVVFDTPPLAECADALAIATIVRRVLALCRAHHTTFRDTREMLRRLAATQAQMLGAVIGQF